MTDHTTNDVGAADTGAATHHDMSWDHHHHNNDHHHHHHNHDHDHDHSGHHHHDPHAPDLHQVGRAYMPDYPVREARWQHDWNDGAGSCSESFKWVLLILLLLVLAFVGGYNTTRRA